VADWLVTDSAAAAWRWNPDAKVVRSGEGAQAINYANGMVFSIPPPDTRVVAGLGGLAIPFRLPADLSADTARMLTALRFVLSAADYDRHEAETRQRIARALQHSHGFIIMPTEKCNLRCTYCYEAFEHGRMSNAHADAVCRAIEVTASRTDDFSLGFFGGEPLLCSDLVTRLSRLAFEIMSARGLPYAASVSTNGVLLTADLFGELLDVGVVSYQISIDGSRELHDRQRPTIGGGPTFDAIIRNLRHMQATDAQFAAVIRCNVAPRDHQHVLDLFQRGELAFVAGDHRFMVDIHHLWASDRVDMLPAADDVACSHEVSEGLDYYRLNRELERLGYSTVPYRGLPGLLGSACYAGKPNWFVIGPDLSLYKCTVVFDRPENRIGQVALDGTLSVDAAKNQLWTGSNAITDSGCASCHYRVPCGGIACPLTRFTDGSKTCPDIRNRDVLQQWVQFFPSDRRPQVNSAVV
jgi:uncharacterized protein